MFLANLTKKNVRGPGLLPEDLGGVPGAQRRYLMIPRSPRRIGPLKPNSREMMENLFEFLKKIQDGGAIHGGPARSPGDTPGRAMRYPACTTHQGGHPVLELHPLGSMLFLRLLELAGGFTTSASAAVSAVLPDPWLYTPLAFFSKLFTLFTAAGAKA